MVRDGDIAAPEDDPQTDVALVDRDYTGLRLATLKLPHMAGLPFVRDSIGLARLKLRLDGSLDATVVGNVACVPILGGYKDCPCFYFSTERMYRLIIVAGMICIQFDSSYAAADCLNSFSSASPQRAPSTSGCVAATTRRSGCVPW